MSTYRFQHRSDQDDWLDVGEQEIGPETTAKEAFARLKMSESLSPGEYRFKRSDESSSHHWGHLKLARDGEIELHGH